MKNTDISEPKQENGIYQIRTAGELYWFAGLVNGTLDGVTQNKAANAVLTADITVNSGLEGKNGLLDSLEYDADGNVTNGDSFISWTPIGYYNSSSDNSRYTGTFDGQGHTISGLYFNNDVGYVGLFGYVYEGGKVSRVGVVDSYFKASKYVGGVCGETDYGTITNCYNSSTVSATSQFVGGVCGQNWYGTITNCYNSGAVSLSRDNTSVGGVCGKNDGTITSCFYDKDKCSVGGIAKNDVTGQAEGKTTIQFNSGEVAYLLQSGQTADGEGNIPEVWGQCLSGETLDDYPVFGGTKVYQHIIGEDEANPSYYYTNSEEANGHIHQMTKVEAKDATCEADGNYEYWTCSLEDGVYYKDENGTARFSSKAATVIAGGHKYTNGICSTCSAGQPAELNAQGVYEISNAGQLYWFAGLVNGTLTDGTAKNTAANAVLTANIVVNSGLEGKNGLQDSLIYDSDGNVTNGASFRSWTPIGNNENQYIGTFDGNGYTVSGLFFNDSTTQYVGLFGYVGYASGNGGLKGKVSNVGIVDSYFKANDDVGGVCGKSWYGTIANCYNTGKVSGVNYIGGVCGSVMSNYGTITNCYNKGDVSGIGNIGGVCGCLTSGTITSSYNTGKVSGTDYIGGVCGYLSSGTITNCYYDSINYTGNAVGYNYDNKGTISENVLGKTTDEFKSGEVAYLLNGSKSVSEEDNPLVWYQNIDNGTEDTHPVLDNTHGIVYMGNPCAVYTNESHKEHRYIISEDGKSHTCSDCGKTEQHADVATFTVDNENHSITATCPSGCELGTVTLSETGEIYDGTEKSHVSGEIKGFSPVIVYEKKAEDGSFARIDSIPKDAGTYRASITYTVGEEPENKYSVSVEYTIAKADTTRTANCEMVLTFDEYSNTYTATITEVEGAEYKFDNGGWSSKNMYTGIAHGTEVTGYIRIAAISDNYNPGTESSKTLTTGHGTMTHYEAKAADCENDGNVEYWYCESCKKYFNDEDGTAETTKEAVTLAAAGHTDSNNDGICEVCNAYIDGIGAKLAGYSLSLNGNIGVNFYMELSSDVIADSSAYMEITLPNTTGKTKVYVTGTHEDGATATTAIVNGKTYYVFSCEVAAKEMTDEIQAQMIIGEDKGTLISYTVKDYADYIFANTETYGDTVAALVKAMLNYGAYSQTYFGYQTEKLANADLAEVDRVPAEVTADDLSSYKAVVSGVEDVCTFKAAYLTLESETAVHVYVKLAEGGSEENVTFSIDGSSIESGKLVKGTGSYADDYELTVADIAAGALDQNHTFTVTAGGQTASLSYGPMSYCYAVLSIESVREELKNVAKALYAYNQAAEQYILSLNQ